jgi:hypothetical protein
MAPVAGNGKNGLVDVRKYVFSCAWNFSVFSVASVAKI